MSGQPGSSSTPFQRSSVRRLGELADAKAREGGDRQGALVAAEERDEPLATQPHVRLDAAEVEDAYVAYDLRAIAGFLGADLADVFAICVDKGFALPHGVETQLRREQYYDLREALGFADAPPEPPPAARYEDFGFKPLDQTAEPMDPAARAMADYVQDADRPDYQDRA